MKRRGRMAAAIVAAITVMAAMPGYASDIDIGSFLTGGSGTQTQDTGNPDIATAGGDTSDSTTDSARTAAAQSLNFVTCTDSQTGINVARAVVPEGYNVTSETTWCGPCQSPDYPAEVFISAESPDGSIMLTYESPLEFVQVLNASVNGLQIAVHQDWTISPDYLMTMLTYMNAQQYCDYTAQNCMKGASDVTFESEKELPQAGQALLQQLSQQKLDSLNQALSGSNEIYADFVETTATERTYRYYDSWGKEKVLIVAAATQGVRIVENISSYGMGTTNIVNMIWSCPGRYCLMVDADRYEEGRAVYDAFCTNTTISDQFKKAMVELSQVIVSTVTNARATALSSQTSYVQDTFSSELSGQEDTYSGADAWDDAIMDRNDYTLSSGDNVKVDTSYDYVYELSDGSVYATDSALDEPAGGTLLYAN